jgi:hypothetical protein
MACQWRRLNRACAAASNTGTSGWFSGCVQPEAHDLHTPDARSASENSGTSQARVVHSWPVGVVAPVVRFRVEWRTRTRRSVWQEMCALMTAPARRQ